MKNLRTFKSIFQIRYKPIPEFYDNLYKFGKKVMPQQFDHWETNRLRFTLIGYQKRHSLDIDYQKVTYETDSFNKKSENSIVKTISENIQDIVDFSHINIMGHRRIYLYPVDMTFDDLEEIIQVKYLSEGLITNFVSSPILTRFSINSSQNGLVYILTVQSYSKADYPNKININHRHIDPQSVEDVSYLVDRHKEFPDVSLMIDLDVKQTPTMELSIQDFHKRSSNLHQEITKRLISYTFQEKID